MNSLNTANTQLKYEILDSSALNIVDQFIRNGMLSGIDAYEKISQSLMMTHRWKYNNYLLYYLGDKLHFMTLSSINIKNSSMYRRSLCYVILDGVSIYCWNCLAQLFAFTIGLVLVLLCSTVKTFWMQKLRSRFPFST